MVPPPATAATKASDVQLAGVPLPTTVSGLEVSINVASEGTVQSSALILVASGNIAMNKKKSCKKRDRNNFLPVPLLMVIEFDADLQE